MSITCTRQWEKEQTLYTLPDLSFTTIKSSSTGLFDHTVGLGRSGLGKQMRNTRSPLLLLGCPWTSGHRPSCSTGAEQWPNRKIKRLGEVGSSLERTCKSIHMWNRLYPTENQLGRDPFTQILWFKSMLFNIYVARLGYTCKTYTRNTRLTCLVDSDSTQEKHVEAKSSAAKTSSFWDVSHISHRWNSEQHKSSLRQRQQLTFGSAFGPGHW